MLTLLTNYGSLGDVKPFWWEAKQSWAVDVPAAKSPTHKRQRKLFATRHKAREFCGDQKEEHKEHGRASVTAEERAVIVSVRERIGDLSQLPTNIDHWLATGAVLSPIAAKDAAKAFLDAKKADYSNKRTWHDVKWRIESFGERFGSRKLHEIGAGDVENFLNGFNQGWNRRSVWKRLRPFFRYAERHRWVAKSPIEKLDAPKIPVAKRHVYTPEQLETLLLLADIGFEDLLPVIALQAFAFLRTRELVRMYRNEAILCWENILWERKLVHVPENVGKTTRRRSGNERFCPINDSLESWLSIYRKKTGEIWPWGQSRFSERWHSLTDQAEISRLDNGLRKSALSYALASNPETGTALLAQWAGNSEAAAKAHYIRLLTKEQGDAWFSVRHK